MSKAQDLAPGWTVTVGQMPPKSGGKAFTVYRLSYQGRDTGKYALDMVKAALLSQTVDPVTGRRKRGGQARANPHWLPKAQQSRTSRRRESYEEAVRRLTGREYKDIPLVPIHHFLGPILSRDVPGGKEYILGVGRPVEVDGERVYSDFEKVVHMEYRPKAKKNPIQFQEPTFGDRFHTSGATGYSTRAGRKGAHMLYFDDPNAAEKALAVFLTLEGAGNLRKAKQVHTGRPGTICVDLNGRRFFAGVKAEDVWIKELAVSEGSPAYTKDAVLWNDWVPAGMFPKLNWFRSVPLKNPVWIRPEGSARARAMETAYDEAYDNPGAQKLEAFSPGEKVEVQFPTQRGPHLWHEGRVVMVQFGDRYVVAIDSGKGDGEQQYSVPGLHMRRKVSAESEAREAAKRLKAELKALLQARNNPGRAQYAAFAQAAKAKGQTPTQIKKAYADKKTAASPTAIRRAAIAAEGEIFALMASIAGEEQARQSVGTHYTFDYKEGTLDLDLPSPEYTHWKVGDPRVVKGIKAIAKKYAPKNVKISVAVSNPRY